MDFDVLAGNDFSSYPVRDKLEHNGKRNGVYWDEKTDRFIVWRKIR